MISTEHIAIIPPLWYLGVCRWRGSQIFELAWRNDPTVHSTVVNDMATFNERSVGRRQIRHPYTPFRTGKQWAPFVRSTVGGRVAVPGTQVTVYAGQLRVGKRRDRPNSRNCRLG